MATPTVSAPETVSAAQACPAVELRPRERGVVCGFGDECLARRFLNMGVRPGSDVELLRRGPLGQACTFRIDGRTLAVRKDEAACLLLHRLAEQL